MTVLGCITERHNIWLVLLAAGICAVGSWTVIRLFGRAMQTTGRQRVGWQILTAIAGGSTIWCTHFVAMLGYEAGVPAHLDPLLTAASLLVAMSGSTLGFMASTSHLGPHAPALGGAIVGLSISAMHYTGMMAYRVEGIVSWSTPYLIASIVLAVIFATVSLHIAVRRSTADASWLASGLLVGAIVTLHFVGMTAFRIEPLSADLSAYDKEAMLTLAIAVAGVGLLILTAAIASYLIDNSTRAESYARLRHMAMNDSLTDLPNRISFNERLDMELTMAKETGMQVATIGIDLDRFKEVNDLRGHASGDEVLKILGQRMANLLREGEFVARLGGDEFGAIQRIRSQGGLTDFLQRLEDALNRPIRLDDYSFTPGASMGIAIYPEDGGDRETLVNNADLALYRAKATHVDKICFYERSMDDAVRSRRLLASDLRDAVANDALEVHYQVQTSISSGEIKGYEALLRWNHRTRGYIPPAEFIPLAEDEGLILKVGEWVLRKACADAALWQSSYSVAVNLSALQLTHTDLPRLIVDVLTETGLPPSRLELELTETAIFTDRERALHVLRQIKELGVSVALDDFGTGYSSLETLRSFPFDKIKLDATFIREVEWNPEAKAIVRAVLALGKSLGTPVLAEGIETQGQLTLLKDEGCDEAQGYLLGRPGRLDHVMRMGGIQPA